MIDAASAVGISRFAVKRAINSVIRDSPLTDSSGKEYVMPLDLVEKALSLQQVQSL